MAGTHTLLAASPSVVIIEAIDEVLVTKVLTRRLSLDEMQQRGIAIDQSNFTVLNFTAVVGTRSNQVKIDFPVAVAKVPSTDWANRNPRRPPAGVIANIPG